MIIVGLLLLAAAAVAAVELIVANDGAPQVTVHMWRWSWTVDAFWLAVTGAGILVAGLLGLFMLKAGSKRERRLRRERRQLAKENRQLAKRAEIAEATQPEPVRDVAPQPYPVPAETTTTPPARTDLASGSAEETYAGEPVEEPHIGPMMRR